MMDTFAVHTDKNPFKNKDISKSLNEYLSLLTDLEGANTTSTPHENRFTHASQL